MEGTIRSSETTAAPETVFDVAADLAGYPEWATGVATTEILEEGADGLARRARFEVDGFIKRIAYELVYEYERPHRIAWTAVPGDDIDAMEGYYEFHPSENGGTSILYALRVEPSFEVPGFLRRQAEKQIITNALRGLRRRAEAVHAE
ncbi:MAG: SRPBCC family protein [Acidimicrobiia bacterium]|nr:SRPBCC family protein [Acidimicrobiia bacterium]